MSTPPAAVPTKRKRATKIKKTTKTIKGDWDVLPHGLGRKGDLEVQNVDGPIVKRSKTSDASDTTPKLGRKRDALNVSVDYSNSQSENVQTTTPLSKVRHPYGLTPGISPFPNYAKPTLADCKEVCDLLSEKHGALKAPDVIPPPSMEVTGCGEVPDVLDALLRTLLSAATTSTNSNMALQGLQAKFGLRTSGIGKGSINWEAVHQADLATVVKSIKSGGLANIKGANIKKILNAVYERNLARFQELAKEKETGEPAQVLGADHETKEQKDLELARFEETMLSMDYLFELTTDEVMVELTKLPGIGVKTSSCVILFCMKRPSFAVDTHVWRHCKWLGWVPEKADRDQTFSHCEVRIPNDLKYALHQLFVKHGKECVRCKAGTSPGTKEWDSEKCPIEHLVKRSGKMKEKKAASDDDI
ncbi:hypothetical protein EG329_003445 [Mollisiaceae sp. DMI_Dod_QoI]|nr:hypothetical protein EG329_003445 [Helotiales sp. DMI_Dod_QoI]